MGRTRTIVPHCNVDAAVIDAFQCSQCEWTYAMATTPEHPFLIAYQDANRACWAFDAHRCEDFKPRKLRSPDVREPARQASCATRSAA